MKNIEQLMVNRVPDFVQDMGAGEFEGHVTVIIPTGTIRIKLTEGDVADIMSAAQPTLQGIVERKIEEAAETL